MLADVAAAQSVRGVVVDQTGLPLPGVEVQLVDGSTLVRALVTRADGTFDIDVSLRGTTVVASLEGFETTRVNRADAVRIVLPVRPDRYPTAESVSGVVRDTVTLRDRDTTQQVYA